MANPNIVNVAAIYGTSQLAALTTAQVAIFNNAAASGAVLKVDELVLANYTTASVTALVKVYSAAALGGPGYNLIPNITNPPNSSIVAIDKSTAKYLVEDRSIGASASVASAVDATGSADVIS